MPNFNIVKKSKVPHTFRTDYIIGKYDLQIQDEVTETFIGSIPLEKINWQIGLIVGGSGTGKTTIAKHLFSKQYITTSNMNQDQPIINCFNKNKDMNTILKTLNSVGLNTVWSYLKPYNVLSNGEKMRVDLAEMLLNDEPLQIFDEFTSVVDRTIAKTSCIAVNKAIRKTSKKIVFVSCHDDIINYLSPDWVYNTDNNTFIINENKKKTTKSELEFMPFLTNKIKKYGNCLVNTTI